MNEAPTHHKPLSPAVLAKLNRIAQQMVDEYGHLQNGEHLDDNDAKGRREVIQLGAAEYGYEYLSAEGEVEQHAVTRQQFALAYFVIAALKASQNVPAWVEDERKEYREQYGEEMPAW